MLLPVDDLDTLLRASFAENANGKYRGRWGGGGLT